jgi:hypothetical protein
MAHRGMTKKEEYKSVQNRTCLPKESKLEEKRKKGRLSKQAAQV